MNKKQIIEHIAAEGFSKIEAKTVVDAVLNTILSRLERGETVSLGGFGTFSAPSPAEPKKKRNALWTRDELIVALDVYLRYAGNPPGKQSAEIAELSDTLNRLGRYLGIARGADFRNANGVYMKLMNFRRFDPAYKAAGKVGLERGGKEEEEVWREFAGDPARCRKVAETIRHTIMSADASETISADIGDGIEEAEEGWVVTVEHQRYERNRKLVTARKAKALKALGKLVCEACGFDFHARYGDRGKGYIECHHSKPVHELRPGEKTRVDDLRLVCANCHRMIHARRPWLTIEQLITKLRQSR